MPEITFATTAAAPTPSLPVTGAAADEPTAADLVTTFFDAETAAGVVDQGGINFGSLTPELILAAVGQRVAQIDSQITDRLTEVNQRSARAAELSEQLAALRSVRGEVPARNQAQNRVVDRHAPISGTGTTAFETLRSAGVSDLPTEGAFTEDWLDQQIETVSNQLGQVNSGNQQTMLELQSLVQQRSQASMMGTQLLSNVHQSASAIANNLK